jgi:valyl-tRNA synthetase
MEDAGAIASIARMDPQRFIVAGKYTGQFGEIQPITVDGVEIYFEHGMHKDPEEERARLQKELQETESQIERLTALLSSDFATRAPAAVVERERQKLETFKETAGKLKQQLAT